MMPEGSIGHFNARSETVLQRDAFKNLVAENRCLIPADAFYEWKKMGKVKQPFAFSLRNRGLFAIAGLWDTDSDGNNSCVILTTEANDVVSEIHDRARDCAASGL